MGIPSQSRASSDGHSPSSFIGEDIELFNHLLAQHSQHDSRRSDAASLDEAYRCLGLFVHSGVSFNEELLECNKFVKGSRRYNLKLDGPEIAKTREFLEKLFLDFANNNFKHYSIPREGLKGRVDGESKTLPMKRNDYRTMRFRSNNTGTKDSEVETLELVDVGYVASIDWVSVLNEKFQSLSLREWKFKEHLKDETVQRFETKFPEYVGHPRPKPPRESKSRKRKKIY